MIIIQPQITKTDFPVSENQSFKNVNEGGVQMTQISLLRPCFLTESTTFLCGVYRVITGAHSSITAQLVAEAAHLLFISTHSAETIFVLTELQGVELSSAASVIGNSCLVMSYHMSCTECVSVYAAMLLTPV